MATRRRASRMVAITVTVTIGSGAAASYVVYDKMFKSEARPDIAIAQNNNIAPQPGRDANQYGGTKNNFIVNPSGGSNSNNNGGTSQSSSGNNSPNIIGNNNQVGPPK